MGNILFVIMFVLSYSHWIGGDQGDNPSKDEYKIYRVIFDQLAVESFRYKRWVVVDSTTNYPKDDSYGTDVNGNKIYFDEIDAFKYRSSMWNKFDQIQLKQNYHFINQKNYPFVIDSIKSKLKLVQITSDSVKHIFKLPIRNCWEYFRRVFKNTNGIIRFSRVGFNKERNQAVVYREYTMDYVNGEGILLLLLKEKNKWKIVSTTRLWAS